MRCVVASCARTKREVVQSAEYLVTARRVMSLSFLLFVHNLLRRGTSRCTVVHVVLHVVNELRCQERWVLILGRR